jgi:hypothetical protein
VKRISTPVAGLPSRDALPPETTAVGVFSVEHAASPASAVMLNIVRVRNDMPFSSEDGRARPKAVSVIRDAANGAAVRDGWSEPPLDARRYR